MGKTLVVSPEGDAAQSDQVNQGRISAFPWH